MAEQKKRPLKLLWGLCGPILGAVVGHPLLYVFRNTATNVEMALGVGTAIAYVILMAHDLDYLKETYGEDRVWRMIRSATYFGVFHILLGIYYGFKGVSTKYYFYYLFIQVIATTHMMVRFFNDKGEASANQK